MSKGYRSVEGAFALVLTAGLAMAGCGTPGAPQPPSLNLPERVADLAAVRAGNQVTLTWTMPKRNTDKLALKENVPVRVCRREGAKACIAAGDLELAPGAEGTFAETLSPGLATGTPRALDYFVELRNRKGRSAGLSNVAAVLAGQSPAAVAGLAAEVRKSGVVLRWTPDNSADAVLLRRALLSKPVGKAHESLMAPPPEPAEQKLLVEGACAGVGQALDQSIVVGQTYEYRAQRVARVPSNGQTLELAGEVSAPIRVEVADIFPPDVPSGLAAVATAPDPDTGTEASVDLSWQPDTETDLAGYEVYRREVGSPWQRVQSQPVAAPAFHDTHVLPGHTYIYAVSAVDQGGRESARSQEAQETVPNP